jgi:glycosyltransferase involved in cell wall biosynthesis
VTHLAYLGQGHDYHVRKWLPALVEQGLKVTLISYSRPGEDLEGVNFEKLDPPFASSSETLSIRDFWGSARPVRRVLDEIDADVLMASYGTNYGWLGVRSGFRPMIAQTWTADITVYPWVGWKRWIFRPMVKRFLQKAELITTDGDALAEEARQRFPDVADKIVSVRWGIRLRDYEFSDERRGHFRAELGIPDQAPVLTSARGLLPIFRPVQVIQALLATLDSRPELHALYLTLARERSDEVQALLDRLGAHPRAHVFDRFLTTEEMQDVWAVTDALISVPEYDGISEGILEAMYAGCVPIVNDIPSNRSFLEDGVSGVYVDGNPDSVANLNDTFESVVDRLPSLQATMVERNRQWVASEASVEATAEAVAKMVRQLKK